MTPTPCVATLAIVHRADGRRRSTRAATSAGCATRSRRGASSPTGSTAASPSPSGRASPRKRWLPGDYEIVPNGVLIPPHADPAGREHRIVFAGRHEQRKGLHVLLQRVARDPARAPARRCASAAPTRSRVRLLMTRLRVPDDGIDVLGFLPQERFTEELLAAKALVAPSLGGESFGIVLTRALACATPVVASDIPGYRDVMTPETARRRSRRATRTRSPTRSTALLADEPRRQAMGAAGRAARAGALRLGRDRAAPRRDLRARRRMRS